MKRLLWILLTIGLFVHNANGQISEVSIDRAMSLSNMADFYYTAHNYEKAIEQEKKALEMKSVLCGTHSLEYATSAFNLAKYYYERGMEGEIDDKR
jgi:tetratricopeptide (TPR) repeat protein